MCAYEISNYLLTLVLFSRRKLNTKEVYEVRKITKKEKNENGEWMYITKWKFYDDVTWETADTLSSRVGAKDVLNDFNKKY